MATSSKKTNEKGHDKKFDRQQVITKKKRKGAKGTAGERWSRLSEKILPKGVRPT